MNEQPAFQTFSAGGSRVEPIVGSLFHLILLQSGESNHDQVSQFHNSGSAI